jgi:hypothetical protein
MVLHVDAHRPSTSVAASWILGAGPAEFERVLQNVRQGGQQQITVSMNHEFSGRPK